MFRHDTTAAPGVRADDARALAALFRLLGDPTRTAILLALAQAGELRVSDIADTIQAEESTVSHALRLLRTAGVVRNRREGRHVLYTLDDDHVRRLLDLTRDHLHHVDGDDDG